MKKNRLKSLTVLFFLIFITGMAMAVHEDVFIPDSGSPPAGPPLSEMKNGIVSVSARLIQDKVMRGSDGVVNMVLTLKADDVKGGVTTSQNAVDMVLVLDRSGSMQGQKINDAKQATLSLLADLTGGDRFGLVSYSDGVLRHCELIWVTDANREKLSAAVSRVFAGGNTNLGAGLQNGLNILSNREPKDRPGKMILISDGLANRGVTQPAALGRMAAVAIAREFSVSTVGLGIEFNEQLMTAIADQGAGSYYYLDQPNLFAKVFEEEFRHARVAAASGLAVRIGQSRGMTLLDASGYPIRELNGDAVFYPGSLGSGQTRKIYLKFRVPTDQLQTFRIQDLNVAYRFQGEDYQVDLKSPLEVACVEDPGLVVKSIDRDGWVHKVLNNDYNQLKEDVSVDIRAGKKEAALMRIDAYRQEQEKINEHVNSQAVAENLGRDLKELSGLVEETFSGDAAQVQRKQKIRSKALQYEGYKGKRNIDYIIATKQK